MNTKTSAISIKKVQGYRDLTHFIKLPWDIYSEDPNWVPPLIFERRMHLSGSNPFFKHAEACFWMALRKGRPVGRISAQIDRLYLDSYGDYTGFWGMLEAVNDKEVFVALFDAAAKWLESKGMKRMLGPFNLSINQECGLLVKGFQHPPFFMMGHNPPHYAERIGELGHKKAKDLIAYIIERTDEGIARIERLLGGLKANFTTRPLDRKNLESELDCIFSIFNNAWSRNWGFVPFSRDEYLELGKYMSKIASPELIRIAVVDGEAAGFIALLPNINEIIRDLDGRLFPFNWIKLLFRLKHHDFNSGRVVLMGVLRKYQGSLAGAAISLCLIRDVIQKTLQTSMKQVELSWILEDNIAMNRIIEALGAIPYKTYRIFEKEIP